MSETRLRIELRRIESHFKQALHEYAHIFTMDGHEETRLKGSKDKVPVPVTVKTLDRLLTHNHPSGNPELSDKDCHLLLAAGLRVVRSYTEKNGGWEIRVPEGVQVYKRNIDYKEIKKLWGKAAMKKHGLVGPALVAKLYNLELIQIPSTEHV